MGHKGDIENRYTTNKHRLPTEVIEGMHEAFKRSQEHLMTTKPETNEDKIKKTFKKQLIAVAGFSEEEIARHNETNMTNEELQNLVRQRQVGVMTNNGARQKVIAAADVERHIVEGWEYIAPIAGEKAIVKMPF